MEPDTSWWLALTWLALTWLALTWLALFLSLSYSVLLSIRQDFNGSTTLIATAYPSGTLMVLLSVFFVDLM